VSTGPWPADRVKAPGSNADRAPEQRRGGRSGPALSPPDRLRRPGWGPLGSTEPEPGPSARKPMTADSSAPARPSPAAAAEAPARPERELTEPVSLTRPNGRLNTDAIGWARHPIVDTSGVGRGGGRNKRWEYWNVITPTHILALTVSSIDYAAVHEVWVLGRLRPRTWGPNATVLPARGVQLPPRLL